MAFKPNIPRKYGTVIACVSEMVASHGGPEPVSVVLACSVPSVYGYTSDTTGADISFAKVVALTDAAHIAAAQFLAAKAGGTFIPGEAKEVSPMLALSDVMQGIGDATSVAMTAFADGKITPDEEPVVLKELDELSALLVTLRAAIVKRAREG